STKIAKIEAFLVADFCRPQPVTETKRSSSATSVKGNNAEIVLALPAVFIAQQISHSVDLKSDVDRARRKRSFLIHPPRFNHVPLEIPAHALYRNQLAIPK